MRQGMDVYVRSFGIKLLFVLVRVDSLVQMGGNLAQVTSPLWSVSHL